VPRVWTRETRCCARKSWTLLVTIKELRRRMTDLKARLDMDSLGSAPSSDLPFKDLPFKRRPR
jgi:hypothetical protein